MDSETRVIVDVVAAVIERGGLILIGQRKPRGRHALKWEFPGGKVEAGEESREALARELREELSIEARIGDEIERYDFSYSAGHVTRLIFFHVVAIRGRAREPQTSRRSRGYPARSCRTTIFWRAMSSSYAGWRTRPGGK